MPARNTHLEYVYAACEAYAGKSAAIAGIRLVSTALEISRC